LFGFGVCIVQPPVTALENKQKVASPRALPSPRDAPRQPNHGNNTENTNDKIVQLVFF
jgi:hypothetical protein